jgi:AGCS family alanine or glycine:cation symporter
VREGIVAALEPFIDTLVVCTLTALVILSTGQWRRGPEAEFAALPPVVAGGVEDSWTIGETAAPERGGGSWAGGESVFMVATADYNPETDNNLHKISGEIELAGDGKATIRWNAAESTVVPVLRDSGVFVTYEGATMTARALDSAIPGLGKWLVSLAVWLFAFSTIISWSYYAEQAVWFLGARKIGLMVYKISYCALALVATLGWLRTDAELDTVTALGTGLMLVVNMPILWIFGWQAMRAYKEYIGRFTSGRMDRGEGAPTLEQLIKG